MYDSGLANRPENLERVRPTFQYSIDVIAEISGSLFLLVKIAKAISL